VTKSAVTEAGERESEKKSAVRDCPSGDADPRAFVSGIVLAAGRSRRMDQNKLLLPLGSRTLLRHVVDEALSSSLDEVVVVLGRDAEAVHESLVSRPSSESAKPSSEQAPPPESRAPLLAHSPALRCVTNPRYEEGQATSLRVGLGAVDTRALAVAILLGDQPGVGADLIDRVLAAFRASESPAARPGYQPGLRPGFRPDSRSGDPPGSAAPALIPGHPVVLDRSLWPGLRALEGDEGARSFLQRHANWLHVLPVAGHPPPDIDTPEDYQRARDARHSAD